jgi:hypothetical protein
MVSDPTRHGVPVDVVEASTLRAADVAHKEDIPRLRAAIVRYRG